MTGTLAGINPQIESILLKEGRRFKTTLYLVGGPVRDKVLGLPCHDWDLACRHARKIAVALSRRLRGAFVPMDEQNRIYRVILPSPPPSEAKITLDFAELQGRSITDDLGRRDFTINAMAVPLNGVLPCCGAPVLRCCGAAVLRFEKNGSTAELQHGSTAALQHGSTGVIDPFGGGRDLKKKIVRAVSEKAFIDDPLRLVRAFRFMAQLGFTIEPKTLRWMKSHGAGLAGVSPERIREEMLRLWQQPSGIGALKKMDSIRLLTLIFPAVESCRRTAIRYYGPGGVLKHSFQTVENLEWIFKAIEPEYRSMGVSGKRLGVAPILRYAETPIRARLAQYLRGTVGGYPRRAWLKWAAFLHDFGKPATAKMIKGRLRFFEHERVGAEAAMRIGRELRCSRQETRLLGLWVRNHMRIGNLAAASRVTAKAYSRFFRDMGEDGLGMILLSLADHYTYLAKPLWGKGKDPVEKMAQRLLTSYFEDRSKILPERLVDGHLLMRELKLKPGPLIGRLLAGIADAQVEGKVVTREEALAFAKRKLR